MSTYIVDALMIGRIPHSAPAIAASSLGNTVFYAIAFCAVYMLSGIDTLVAQQFGRGDTSECGNTLLQGLWIVAIATPLVMLLPLGFTMLLPRFGTPPELAAETLRYLKVLVWSTPPLLTYMAFRRYLQGIERVSIVSISLLTAGLVNWGADWVFIYGHLGARPMGLTGSAVGTCLVRWWMMALLLYVVLRSVRKQQTGVKLRFLPDFPRLRALFRIGWPASIDELSDLGTSTCLSILCARLGTAILAAHQVVLDLDAVIFMVPVGLSYATVVRVGQGTGRRNSNEVARSANAGLMLAAGTVGLLIVPYILFRHMWASFYTNDPSVVALAAPILLIGGVSLLFDGFQSVASSAFAGTGDTRTPLVIGVTCNWIIGMPFAYWAAFGDGMGLKGLWAGRLIASFSSALAMYTVWRLRLRRMRQPDTLTSLALVAK